MSDGLWRHTEIGTDGISLTFGGHTSIAIRKMGILDRLGAKSPLRSHLSDEPKIREWLLVHAFVHELAGPW